MVTCAILAMTRKHLNCEIIWPHEMELVTLCSFSYFKGTYAMVESKYADSFPDHSATQQSLVRNRQKVESPHL